MTDSPRDLDRTLQAFLDAGPDQMSDRLAEAIRTDVQRTRQRGALAPWRFPQMSRFTLFGATAVVAVVVVALALVMTRPAANVGTNASPTPSAAASRSPGATHDTALGGLVVGDNYRASTFSTPFSFTVPLPPSTMRGPITGDALDAAHIARIHTDDGAVVIGDGVGLPQDFCHPENGPLTELGKTPEQVTAWFRAMQGLTMGQARHIVVPGGVALAWNFVVQPDCFGGSDQPPAHGVQVWFSANERHDLYAVPTGKGGMVLVVTFGKGYGGQGEEGLADLATWTDALVKAMHFE